MKSLAMDRQQAGKQAIEVVYQLLLAVESFGGGLGMRLALESYI